MLFRSTPRTDRKLKFVVVTAASTRPRPSVGARSAKIGPGEVDVATGAPPSNRNVRPLLVALTGRLVMLLPMAAVRNEISVALPDTAEGMKWLPCAWTVAGLVDPAVPARNSAASPEPKMKRLPI